MSKQILITGASTGFGRGMAEQLALRGDRVFATMRDVNGRNAANREALEAFAKAKSLALRVLELDVTDQASVTPPLRRRSPTADGSTSSSTTPAWRRSASRRRIRRNSSSSCMRSTSSACSA